MEAYEFYWLDPKGGFEVMGVLPERRKDSARVTQESIMQWGKTIFSNDFDPKDIFFIQRYSTAPGRRSDVFLRDAPHWRLKTPSFQVIS